MDHIAISYLWVSCENFDIEIRLTDTRFLYKKLYFGDLNTFSVDFCIRFAECPPYFYFRPTWPTDLQSVSRVSPLTMEISTQFEADTTIRWLVIAFLLLIHDLVTLTFDLLI